jgi:hypothetical protein
VGLNATFVASELRLMASIVKGAALAHHMEPLYYLALQNSLQAIGAGLIQAAEKEEGGRELAEERIMGDDAGRGLA